MLSVKGLRYIHDRTTPLGKLRSAENAAQIIAKRLGEPGEPLSFDDYNAKVMFARDLVIAIRMDILLLERSEIHSLTEKLALDY